MKRSLLLPALLALAGLAAAQGISTEAWYAVPDARGVQLVNVACGEDFIDPREIVVEPGVPVELSVRSSEPDQEFVSGLADKLPVDKAAKKVAFTPKTNGKHEIACKKRGSADRDVNPRKRGVLHVGHPNKKS